MGCFSYDFTDDFTDDRPTDSVDVSKNFVVIAVALPVLTFIFDLLGVPLLETVCAKVVRAVGPAVRSLITLLYPIPIDCVIVGVHLLLVDWVVLVAGLHVMIFDWAVWAELEGET